jgi:transposase
MTSICRSTAEADGLTCGPATRTSRSLTKAYMLFLAHWARKLSWQETATAFRSTWDKVCQAVEYVVEWGLEHRNVAPIQAIGVDEIQYAKGHKYLTLVYQIEQGCTRLLWIGKDRTVESFEQFFTLIGKPLSESIEFVCSDMWKPYLRVIRERCAVNILDRFHIVAKMNEALDDVRAAQIAVRSAALPLSASFNGAEVPWSGER